MKISIISMILLASGLCGMIGSLAWVLSRGNRNRLTRLFISCQTSIVLWIVSEMLIQFSETKPQYWISYLIGNVGISCFGPLWLMVTAEYAGASLKTRNSLNLTMLISLASVLVIFTNEKHHLYYSVFEAGKVEYGPLFYTFQIIYYVCIIAGFIMIGLKHKRRHERINKQSVLLILSTAIPLAVNTLFITGFIVTPLPLTPFIFGLSSLLLMLALGRYGLLNINTIAMRDTIDNIDSGVIIFDADQNISYQNKYTEGLTFLKDIRTVPQFIRTVSEAAGYEIPAGFSSSEIKCGNEYYSLKQNEIENSSGNPVARIITITNVTEYHEYMAAEKKLSLEQERNRIAQEMHDSAGHTFTMISALARMLQSDVRTENQDNSEVLDKLSEIDGLSRSGVTQLRCTINNLRDQAFMSSVTNAVQSVITAVRSIETELCIQGEEDERYQFCISEMYDNCRETITNAMRYSNADKIDIILKFLPERIELHILDNGCGCKDIEEHNGLRGIRSRTEKLGGTVRFMSVAGEGFHTSIQIPVREVKI
ncbi:MAG: two-component sensor histidine kinase [Ruminococcus sp.]|nr:two-component sensor histidine kinase [Ruminococcus sp.]